MALLEAMARMAPNQVTRRPSTLQYNRMYSRAEIKRKTSDR